MTQEEKKLPEGLEEAAEKAGLEYAPIIAGEALDLSGQFYETDDVDWPSRCGFINGFKAGAEWMKSKMLEDAVEGYVNYYEDSGGILMAEAQVGCPYHNGDKVRIVVLKEKEE